jgi:hypothetical protein
MTNFEFIPDKIEEKNGMVYVWRNGTGWPVAPDDVDAFIAHMSIWLPLNCKQFSRDEYETLCLANNVTPEPDERLGGYRDSYGDFGMSHYHTDPKNRQIGIASTLHQGRSFGLKQERKQQVGPISEVIIQIGPEPKIKREGQLWEPCKCGREPVYMPLHLCDKCWPKEVSK